jgi:hypothetical protein
MPRARQGTIQGSSDFFMQEWVPVDDSGAGLVFTARSGFYLKLGAFVFAFGRADYPATLDTSTARIGGLPFACHFDAYGAIINTLNNSATDYQGVVRPQNTNMEFYAPGTFTTRTNADFASSTIRFLAIYRVNSPGG